MLSPEANQQTEDDVEVKPHRLERIYDLKSFEPDKETKCLSMDPMKQLVNKASRRLRKRGGCMKLVKKRIPIIDWLPKYKFKNFILPDVMSGLTVGIMNIPQGLAYALLATLNPIYGLYVSFFPIIVYTIFGTCKHLVIGGVGIISLITGSVIDQMVHEHFRNETNGTSEAQFRVDIACQLSLLVGLIHFLMGLVGLGFVSSFFSDTFISGYTCASAIHVVMSQVKDIFGIRKLNKYNGVFKIPRSFIDFVSKIYTSNWITFGFSLSCILFLLVCKEVANPMIKKRLHFEFPSELVLIIIMTFVSYISDLNTNFNISILENIPTGLPTPRVPQSTYMLPLLKDALLIATISFSISLSLAALFSRKKKYKIDPTQELYALGLSGFTGSFFSCYPIAGSLSRTSVVAEIGAKTQLSSVFSCSVLIIVIIWLAPYLKTLPNLCLACIIVVALKGLLFQVKDLAKLWRINKFEFVMKSITWLLTFLSVVILDVDWGLFIGLATSILVVIIRDQMAPLRHLRKPVNKLTLFREDFVKLEDSTSGDNQATMSRPDREIKVYKVEHSIYFANCKLFANRIYKQHQLKPSQHHVKVSVLHQKNNAAAAAPAAAEDEYDELNCAASAHTSETTNGSEIITASPRVVIVDDNDDASANNTAVDVCDEDFILDFSAVNYIDTNGIQTVEELIDDFASLGVFVYICRPQESFLKMIYRLGLIDKFDAHVFLSIEDAFKHFNIKKSS